MSNRAERRRKERARKKAQKDGAKRGRSGDAEAKAGAGVDPGAGSPGGRGYPGRSGAADRPFDTVPPARMAVLAAALALLAGVIEVAVVIYLKRLGLIVRLSPHFPWMIPVAHLLTFLGVTGVLLTVRRVWARAGSRPVTVGALMALTTFSAVGVIEAIHPGAVAVLAVGVGVQAGRMADGRFVRALFRSATPVAALLGVALVAVTVTSFAGPRRAEGRALEGSAGGAAPVGGTTAPAGDASAELVAGATRPGSPNVLLVVMDAVRARSMGLYNPRLRNTPVLNALAAESVVFDRAYAPSPWTLPTHATLFTGRWPTEHEADWKVTLDRRFPTLAERFTAAGYATGGFTANLAFTGPEQGLARGFGRYEAYPVNLGQIVLSTAVGRNLADLETPRRWLGLELPLNEVPAEEVTDRFLDWRERHPDRPFFAFLNYYDAHEPFPPAPNGPPITPLTYRHSLLSGVVTHFEAPAPTAQDRFLQGYLAGYQAAIAYIDREIQRLLRELSERGDLDRTLLVVVSDHGEVIGEHRLVGHNSSLYHPNLWVPLMIRYPESVPGGVRIPDEVTIRHLPATILELAGVENETGIPGRSLAALWTGPAAVSTSVVTWPDTLYAHLTGGEGFPPWAPAALGPEMHSLVRDRWHYILNGDGSEELYDLRRDPGELRNLVDRPEADSLRTALRERIRSVPGAEPLPGSGGLPD